MLKRSSVFLVSLFLFYGSLSGLHAQAMSSRDGVLARVFGGKFHATINKVAVIDNNLWIASSDGAYMAFREASGSGFGIRRYSAGADARNFGVYDICKIGNDIWLGTDQGIHIVPAEWMEGAGNEKNRAKNLPHRGIDALDRSKVRFLLPTYSKGIVDIVWIGARSGLFTFSVEKGVLIQLLSKDITALASNGNDIFAGTRDNAYRIARDAANAAIQPLFDDAKYQVGSIVVEQGRVYVSLAAPALGRLDELLLVRDDDIIAISRFLDPRLNDPLEILAVGDGGGKVGFATTRGAYLVDNAELDGAQFDRSFPAPKIDLSLSKNEVIQAIETIDGRVWLLTTQKAWAESEPGSGTYIEYARIPEVEGPDGFKSIVLWNDVEFLISDSAIYRFFEDAMIVIDLSSFSIPLVNLELAIGSVARARARYAPVLFDLSGNAIGGDFEAYISFDLETFEKNKPKMNFYEPIKKAHNIYPSGIFSSLHVAAIDQFDNFGEKRSVLTVVLPFGNVLVALVAVFLLLVALVSVIRSPKSDFWFEMLSTPLFRYLTFFVFALLMIPRVKRHLLKRHTNAMIKLISGFETSKAIEEPHFSVDAILERLKKDHVLCLKASGQRGSASVDMHMRYIAWILSSQRCAVTEMRDAVPFLISLNIHSEQITYDLIRKSAIEQLKSVNFDEPLAARLLRYRKIVYLICGCRGLESSLPKGEKAIRQFAELHGKRNFVLIAFDCLLNDAPLSEFVLPDS